MVESTPMNSESFENHTQPADCSSKRPQYEGELFLQVLARNVFKLPENPCLAFLDGQGDIVKSFTRGQLWKYSEAVALLISRKHGVSEGDRVMIVYPPGIDYAVAFIACLRLGAIVVSVYPPNPAKLKVDIPKFSHFVHDSGSLIALTTKTYKKVVKVSAALGQKWPDLNWIATDSYEQVISETETSVIKQGCIDEPRKATDLALIQYTSGSTGNPKGVMISHGNISHQTNFTVQSWTSKVSQMPIEQIKYVGWVPQGCLTPLYGGYMAYGMSPLSFLRDPTLWPRVLERYKAHMTCGPNFAYNLACKRTDAIGLCVDLSGMLCFTNGGEPLDPLTPARVKRTWNTGDAIFRNGYGQAETTLAVACLGNGMHDNRISVGDVSLSLTYGLEVCIAVERDGVYVKANDGEEGEVWSYGPSVAVGYWNKPELTAETFYATLQGCGSKLYQRSGDAGYIHEDKLYVTTRLKDLIIINGKNIAPTDIEKSAEDNFAIIRPGCSVAFQPEQEPHAILVCEVRAEQVRNVVLERLANDIRAFVVANLEVPIGDVVLVKARSVPKTTSGKVQRKECASRWKDSRLAVLYSLKAWGDKHAFSGLGDHVPTSLKGILEQAGVVQWNETLAANGVDSLALSQVVNLAQQIGLNIPYQDAMQVSANVLLERYSSADGQGSSCELRLPKLRDTPKRAYYQNKSFSQSVILLLRQLLVISTTITSIMLATIPPAILTNELYDSNASAQWIWLINGRLGPITVAAVALWMVTFTVIGVVLKWVLIGRQKAGSAVGYRMWSNGYMRWMMVQSVFNVWEHTCGRFVVDTPLLNIIYVILGADIHPSARLQSFIRDWDLVTIKRESHIKGLVHPHFCTASGVVFNQAIIGQGCTLGTQSVAQAPLTLEDDCDVRACSYLPPHTSLSPGVYAGNPVSLQQPSPDDPEETDSTYTPWHLTRLLLPVVFFLFSSVAAAGMGALLPDVSVYRASPVWSWEYLLVVLTYLAMYQLIGLCMLLMSVILKWTFICPFMTDAFANVAFNGFFIYLTKTIAIKYWHRLFGMKVGTGSLILTQSICLASEAHRIVVGKGCLIVNCTLAPGKGPTVWSWLSGSTGSPWWGTEAKHKSIKIGDGSQVLLKSRVEADVEIQPSCTVAANSRIPARTRVQTHTTAVGNPYLCESVGVSVESKEVFVVTEDPLENTPVPKTVAIPGVLTPHKCDKPQQSPQQQLRSQSPSGLRLPKRLLFMHVVLLAITLTVLGLAAMLSLLGLSALPIYNMHYIPRIILSVLYGLCCLVGCLWIFVWITKWLLIGKSSERVFTTSSAQGVKFLYIQGLHWMVVEVVHALFSGTFVMNAYIASMGATTSLLFTQNFTKNIEPVDAAHITLRPGAVLSNFSYATCHRASRDEVTIRDTALMSGAVLHPCAGILLGSVGSGTQLMPLSMPLREMHMAEDQIWVGAPAFRAETATEVVDMEQEQTAV